MPIMSRLYFADQIGEGILTGKILLRQVRGAKADRHCHFIAIISSQNTRLCTTLLIPYMQCLRPSNVRLTIGHEVLRLNQSTAM